MKTDKNIACRNPRQSFLFAAAHDLIAHPFMVLTGYSKLSRRFHDYTSERAFPRNMDHYINFSIYSEEFGTLDGRKMKNGIWEISHPGIRVPIRFKASNIHAAIECAEEWFRSAYGK